jgi:hypothetical protein
MTSSSSLPKSTLVAVWVWNGSVEGTQTHDSYQAISNFLSHPEVANTSVHIITTWLVEWKTWKAYTDITRMYLEQVIVCMWSISFCRWHSKLLTDIFMLLCLQFWETTVLCAGEDVSQVPSSFFLVTVVLSWDAYSPACYSCLLKYCWEIRRQWGVVRSSGMGALGMWQVWEERCNMLTRSRDHENRSGGRGPGIRVLSWLQMNFC